MEDGQQFQGQQRSQTRRQRTYHVYCWCPVDNGRFQQVLETKHPCRRDIREQRLKQYKLKRSHFFGKQDRANTSLNIRHNSKNLSKYSIFSSGLNSTAFSTLF